MELLAMWPAQLLPHLLQLVVLRALLELLAMWPAQLLAHLLQLVKLRALQLLAMWPVLAWMVQLLSVLARVLL